jgi:DNA repair protein RecO (recombination protein O)
MIVNTSAIVLKTFSYGETSLISRCFTKDKGKVSFIIKGAKSKKSLVAPYFQPLSFVNIIFNENEKRELQIVSKVSFEKIWTKIPLSLKKMTLSQSILEISDFTLENNDPYPRLFKILIETFQHFETGDLDENICFWFYESKLLSEMGFMIDMEDRNTNRQDLVSLEKTDNSFKVLSMLIGGNIFDIDFDNISKIDKKNISKFLYQKLCYYFEGFERLNSFRVIKDIFYKG